MLNSYTIYTDGSDLKHTTGRKGIGGVLVDDNSNQELFQFGEELERDLVVKNYNTTEFSNPFAEMYAVKTALTKFSDYIKSPAKIIIKSDYQGVRDWMTGAWKTKAPYIAKIKNEIDSIIKQHKDWDVEFIWVKGHLSIMDKDSYYNNLVDKLAKTGKV